MGLASQRVLTPCEGSSLESGWLFENQCFELRPLDEGGRVETDQTPGPILSWSQSFLLVRCLEPVSVGCLDSWDSRGRPLLLGLTVWKRIGPRGWSWLSSLQEWREGNPSFRG